ncbi:unnamed protein product [Kluyveromyces dobzhanskii CBS 2104]|nr:unnamed protein product [Kluyveromyces dobzhanskii CBS 2104]
MSATGQGYDYTIGPTQTLPNIPAGSAPVAGSLIQNTGIYDQTLISKDKKVSLSAYTFLFQSVVSYYRDSSKNVQEIERKLNSSGYTIGTRLTEILNFRDSIPNKTGLTNMESVAGTIASMKRRNLKILETLQYIHLTVWQYLFSRPSNDLVKSSERENEFMIIDNEPAISQFIQHTSVQCESFTCGIIEGFLDMAGFPCHVSSHFVEEAGFSNRTSESLPLRAKSTNVRKRSGFDKNIRFLGDTNSVGGQRVDKYVKQPASAHEDKDEENVLFASDHVSIRFGELTPKSRRKSKEPIPHYYKEQQQQRLIDSPNTSLQLSDFDVPPESTSTPLPSPSKYSSSLVYRNDEHTFSPIYHSTNYNWNPELHDPETIGQRIYSPSKPGKGYGRRQGVNDYTSESSDEIAYQSSAGNATYHGSESHS